MWNKLRNKNTPNIGTLDKNIRGLAALILFGLVLFQVIGGWFGVIPSVIAIYLVITGTISYSPLYKLFGWSTINK